MQLRHAATIFVLAAALVSCAPAEEQAGGLPRPLAVANYPEGPYGTSVGDIIQDKALYGYKNADSEWDVVRLSDFYDPEGKNHTVMHINVSARWCTVCQAEARAESPKCTDDPAVGGLAKRGLVCYSAIFEGTGSSKKPPKPATKEDVDAWRDQFELSQAVVQDETMKWGEFFDKSATPLNMVVDLKTMQIVYVTVGYDPASIDREVNKRLNP